MSPRELGEIEDAPPQVGAGWLIIFTDLISLLLAFFVLLYSMSQVEHDAWISLVSGLRDRLNPSNAAFRPVDQSRRDVSRAFVPAAVDLGYLNTLLQEKITGHPILGRAILQRVGDRLLVSLPGDILFPQGSAGLREDARLAAAILAEALNVVGNQVDVVGYSDPTPVRGGGTFSSNWDLSLSRSLAFAAAMRAGGYRHPFNVFGRGSGLYYDLSPRLAQETRLQLGRRVDLVIREQAWGEGSL